MRRFLAIVGVAAFLAACSDANVTNPVSRTRPGAASLDGDPPPPPLSGTGDGSLVLGFSDLAPQATTTCSISHSFGLSYSFSYLAPDPNNQQVVHLALDGTPTTGEITLHKNQNGKSNAQGNISDGSFSFNLQSGDIISLTEFEFDFQVTGVLTNLATGEKCTVSGQLEGSLVELIG